MLEAPPLEQGLTVEYPIGHQDENSPIGLIMQLENEYLTDILHVVGFKMHTPTRYCRRQP
jgi:hypothetical protein